MKDKKVDFNQINYTERDLMDIFKQIMLTSN